MNPYFMMVVLYLALAALMAADSALTGLQILPAISGLRWLRVHVITLGAVAQAIFGLLPLLVAARNHRPRPPTRWEMWLVLNAGLLLLLAGIPQYSSLLIISGGTLVFVAVVMLIFTLYKMKPAAKPLTGPEIQTRSEGRKFYLAGLSFFLIGILVGSGLWFNWADWLRIRQPLEVHIHANIWGFASLVLAGLLVDLYSSFAGRPLAWQSSITPIFWMMVIGATGAVLGPWFQAAWLTGPGILLYLAATAWLMANVIRPLRGDRRAWKPGMLHLVIGYAWILAPILGAPLSLLNLLGLNIAGIEQDAPMTLVFSWMLQVGYALIPYIFSRVLQPEHPSRLGGNWLSLISLNIASAMLWASLLAGDLRPALSSIAFFFLAVSMLPVLIQLDHILNNGLSRPEAGQMDSTPADEALFEETPVKG